MIGPRRAAAWLLLVAPLVASVAASCKVVSHGGDTSASTGSSGDGGADGGTGSGGSAPLTGRDLFDSTVKDGLMMECGSCHQLGGIADAPFLAAPDIYVSVTTWPGVITSTPDLSIILTHPADSSHGGGQAPDMSQALRAKVKPWLEFEAERLPKPDGGGGPLIPPFKPFLMGAFNAVYLDPLGTDFQNSSITFNAQELGNPPSLLYLTNIQVHPIAGIDLHIVHPLFTIYTPKGEEIPDTVDSFSGFDQSYSLDGDPTLGTGSLVLSKWQKDSRISIAFEKVEVTKTGGGNDTCKDVAKFQAEVVPQLKMWTCAPACHGGLKIEAQQQMDLSMIDAMPPSEACSQVRARIKPGDPESSQILIVTDPTQQVIHLFKFQGNKTNYNTFKNAVTPWIMAEQ
jgi:hypothetical protein